MNGLINVEWFGSETKPMKNDDLVDDCSGKIDSDYHESVDSSATKVKTIATWRINVGKMCN